MIKRGDSMIRVWSKDGDGIYNILDVESVDVFLEEVKKESFELYCDIVDGEGIIKKGDMDISEWEDDLYFGEWIELELNE